VVGVEEDRHSTFSWPTGFSDSPTKPTDFCVGRVILKGADDLPVPRLGPPDTKLIPECPQLFLEL